MLSVGKNKITENEINRIQANKQTIKLFKLNNDLKKDRITNEIYKNYLKKICPSNYYNRHKKKY